MAAKPVRHSKATSAMKDFILYRAWKVLGAQRFKAAWRFFGRPPITIRLYDEQGRLEEVISLQKWPEQGEKENES